MRKIKESVLALPVDESRSAQSAADVRVTTFERWLARKLLELAACPALHLVLWNGEEIRLEYTRARLKLILRDRAALYQIAHNPTLHFGDLYSTGRVELDGDLLELLDVIYAIDLASPGVWWLKRLQAFARHRPRANTFDGSKTHIHHHYDIGNAFYALWLDREMQYTCAYFPDPNLTLEQAQHAKMEHICRKLQLTRGDRVVEAGCGWGGLARYMARAYGARVRAYNISQEQIGYARSRAKAEGLDGFIEYVEDDYRNITGEYDKFVSVGMLEHVGPENYGALGDVIDRVLTPNGRGLIHTIGRNLPSPMNAWIEKRIFPGAYPPTLGEMMAIFEPHQFSVLDVENLRLHYVRTLQHWLTRFEDHADRIEAMFDANFVRAWRLYLAGSLASFKVSSLQLFQVAFTRARNNDLPWSRAHLYNQGNG